MSMSVKVEPAACLVDTLYISRARSFNLGPVGEAATIEDNPSATPKI